MEKIESLKRLKLFNDTMENLVYLKEHQSYTFAVTCHEAVRYDGKIDSICFYGYILEFCHENFAATQRIVELTCEVVYDLEYGYLKEIAIDDFQTIEKYQNMGFGSIVLKQLIQYAEYVKIEYISGWLSPEDIGKEDDSDPKKKENRKRLYHFYPKHGFVITKEHTIMLARNTKNALTDSMQ